MKLFITLLIIFLVILIIGLFSYVFILYIFNKKKNNNEKIGWKIKYIKQLIIGVIIFSIAGIVVNLINYFN